MPARDKFFCQLCAATTQAHSTTAQVLEPTTRLAAGKVDSPRSLKSPLDTKSEHGSNRLHTSQERALMRLALAHLGGGSAHEVPVAALVFAASGELLAAATNTRAATGNYAGHAEINALNAAAANLGQRVLTDCTLVVTLEPCVMCAGAILASRVGKVIFGAWDEKAGACGSVYDLLRDGRLPHPVPEVIGGVLAAECALPLSDFFTAKR